MDLFARSISGFGNLGKPVLNKTGVTGNIDFTLEFVMDAAQMGPNASPGDVNGPNFLEALQEQMGLKLNSDKGPVEMILVDHIEHPSAN